MKAVIDTNVLVSSLLSRSDDAATVRIMTKVLAGDIALVYSEQIISEYREVLARPRFGFSESAVGGLLGFVEQNGLMVIPETTGVVLPDIDDVPFYEAALQAEDGTLLITGNIKHFPNVPFAVTPREALEMLNRADE